MPFTITVTESQNACSSIEPIQRYSQTVDSLDLGKLIAAVNVPQEPPKLVKKRRSDAGKPRAPKPQTAEVK